MQEKDPKKLARLVFIIGILVIAILLGVVIWQLIVIHKLQAQLVINPAIHVKQILSYAGRCLCL